MKQKAFILKTILHNEVNPKIDQDIKTKILLQMRNSQ